MFGADPDLLILLVLAIAAIISVIWGALDAMGAVSGYLAGLFIFLGAGLSGLLLLGVFFVAGSLATRWNISRKVALGLEQENKGRRSVANVLGNGGVAALLGLLAWFFPEQGFLLGSMLAASLASATSDTLSSEMGNLFGSRYYRILGFQPGERGEDGVISPEGSAFGLLGTALVALAFGLVNDWSWMMLWIGVAGLAGNVADSVLGGSLQKDGYLNNHSVNFFSTLAAAMILWGLASGAGKL